VHPGQTHCVCGEPSTLALSPKVVGTKGRGLAARSQIACHLQRGHDGRAAGSRQLPLESHLRRGRYDPIGTGNGAEGWGGGVGGSVPALRRATQAAVMLWSLSLLAARKHRRSLSLATPCMAPADNVRLSTRQPRWHAADAPDPSHPRSGSEERRLRPGLPCPRRCLGAGWCPHNRPPAPVGPWRT
jgi:hypothetical protein